MKRVVVALIAVLAFVFPIFPLGAHRGSHHAQRNESYAYRGAASRQLGNGVSSSRLCKNRLSASQTTGEG